MAEAACVISPSMDFTNDTVLISVQVDPANAIIERSKSNNTYSVEMVFNPDLNHNGLPDWWEEQFLGGASTNWTKETIGANGLSYWQDYVAGLNPANTNDSLNLSIFNQPLGNGQILRWNSVLDRVYSIYMKEDLADPSPWTRVYRVEGTGGPMAYTNSLYYTNLFLRLGIDQP